LFNAGRGSAFAIPFKVCCIQSAAEAAVAVRAGASAVGLVSAMPSGPGVIDEALIASIAPALPEGVLSVLLTSAVDADAIAAQARRAGVSALQIVDAVAPEVHRELRRALPAVVLLQVIHVVDEASVDEAIEAAARPEVDALLLDSGNPRLAVKELGGTGRVHDWSLSARICRGARVPVLLAGGLRPDNVRGALEAVGPAGVDVCSGVRTDGRLDEAKLRAFATALRAGGGAPAPPPGCADG
jgi:phosphoribosylanthranilate isomerase